MVDFFMWRLTHFRIKFWLKKKMFLGFRQMLHLYDVRHASFPIISFPNLMDFSVKRKLKVNLLNPPNCRECVATMFCCLCNGFTDVSWFYYCICLIYGFFFLIYCFFFILFTLSSNQTGRTSGWKFSEENDPDLWEKVIQKSGTENKVSRQSWKVSLFVLCSVAVVNLYSQIMPCEINAKDIYYEPHCQKIKCLWQWVVTEFYWILMWQMAIQKSSKFPSSFYQVYGIWVGSKWHYSGNARNCHHSRPLPSAGGASCCPFSAWAPQSRKHWYPFI